MKRQVWVIEKNYGKGFEIPKFAYNLFTTHKDGLKELKNIRRTHRNIETSKSVRWKMPQSVCCKYRLIEYVPKEKED